MQLALLDASLGTPHAKRNFAREVDASLTIYDVNDGHLPPRVTDPAPIQTETGAISSFDGVIVSGSQSSVYEDQPWIHELSAWTEEALSHGKPVLGVCWGHQLLAQVLGGTVEGGSYELGYVEVNQVKDDPLLEGLPDPFTVFATHSDHVIDLPAGADLLASNETGIQAFRYQQAYAVQFHPEYDLRTAKAMIGSKELPQSDLEEALATCTEANVAAARTPKRIFDNFLEHVATASTRSA